MDFGCLGGKEYDDVHEISKIFGRMHLSLEQNIIIISSSCNNASCQMFLVLVSDLLSTLKTFLAFIISGKVGPESQSLAAVYQVKTVSDVPRKSSPKTIHRFAAHACCEYHSER